MQSMSYDEWLANKREEDKKRNTQRDRELIDSHLEAVIAELGKQRVERILSPKRRVDTGLKKSACSQPEPQRCKVDKTGKYKWAPAKKHRPEPQGCDCPDSGQEDGESVTQTETQEKGEDEAGSSPEKKSVPEKSREFCREVNDKCEELKPSIDKVLSILDAEMKKQRVDKRNKAKNVESNSDDKDSVEAQRGSEAASSERSRTLRPKTARPARHSAAVSSKQTDRKRSGVDTVDLCSKADQGTLNGAAEKCSLTTKQAAKIRSDMDVLGLCSSGSDEQAAGNNAADKSTVRENYFDYGSDVDPVSMRPATYEAPLPGQSV